MSIPLVDINVKHVIDFTIKTIQSDPDTYIREIFGDAALEPNAAILGNNFFAKVKNWLTTTKIPVVIGFELDPTMLPGVTVHLQGASPQQSFLGDAGMVYAKPLNQYERTVLVPEFSPKELIPSIDGSYVSLVLPSHLPDQLKVLIQPGLHIRCKNKKEYGIGIGPDFHPTAFEIGKGTLAQADFSEICIVSPYTDVLYRQGVMFYENMLTVACHGHAERNEGLWLWAMVHWGLLKYRPLLISTFGMDLAMPSASDFSKDDSFLGENVWTRYITLSTKSVWSWSGPKQRDLLAFIECIRATNACDVPPVTVS